MLFNKFFVVSGVGVSRTSRLNAFDKALMAAGIAQCNIVPVSSILSKKAKQISPVEIEAGSITFAVLANAEGDAGETVTAGLGWALCTNQDGEDTYGIVIEEHGNGTEKEAKEILKLKLKEATESRKMKIKKQDLKTATLRKIPDEHHGSAVVALIYTQ
jgi:arginine decarboxylase